MNQPQHLLRFLFFLTVIRPLVLFVLGLNARRRQALFSGRASVVVANHNSHLDVFVLMTLFPMRELHRLRPVAARDYFGKSKLLMWFSEKIVGIIPIDRDLRGVRGDPLEKIDAALNNNQIVILFPEGTRGEPERMSKLRTGVAHIAERHPEVPVVPVVLHGAGKAMPKGEALLVPFIIDVYVGEPLVWCGNRREFMEALETRISVLVEEGGFKEWL